MTRSRRTRRTFTDEQKAEIINQVLAHQGAGLNFKEAAAAVDVVPSVLHHWVSARRAAGRRAGKPTKETAAMKKQRRRRQFDDRFRGLAVQRVLNGEIAQHVANELDITPGSLRAWVEKERKVRQAAHARAAKHAKARPQAAASANGHHPGAVWVTYDDKVAHGLFSDELQALRAAVEKGMRVREVQLPVENLRELFDEKG